MSDVFVALADTSRRQLLEALAKKPGQSVNDLVALTKLGQPTVSKHLKTLREANLVSVKVSGSNRFYSVNEKPLTEVTAYLHKLGANDAADEGLVAVGELLGELLSSSASWVGEFVANNTNIETDPREIGKELGRKLFDAKQAAEVGGKKVADKVVTKAKTVVKRKPKA